MKEVIEFFNVLFYSFLEIITRRFEATIAFISGDVLTMIFSVYFLDNIHWMHPFLKIVMSLIIGFCGGFAGLVGKDVYNWAKKKWLK